MMTKLEKHLISSRECTKLVEDYDRTIYKEINRNLPSSKEQSKFYTIELDVLQDYLKMISAEMDKKGISQKGVRINLGKYPESTSDPRLDPDFLGYQMVFISPADLDHPQNIALPNTDEGSQSKSFDDVPNLNYMNISPPK